MAHKRSLYCLIMFSTLFLSGCMGSYLWTGASLFYDRHHVKKAWHDQVLSAKAHHLIFKDQLFRCSTCVVDITAFHDTILFSGHVPSDYLKNELIIRLTHLSGYRYLYDQVSVSTQPAHSFKDTWITTKIRTAILSDDTIDPNLFKVVTTDRIVYLMGEAEASQVRKIVKIARQTQGVVKVVKLLKTYVIAP